MCLKSTSIWLQSNVVEDLWKVQQQLPITPEMLPQKYWNNGSKADKEIPIGTTLPTYKI